VWLAVLINVIKCPNGNLQSAASFSHTTRGACWFKLREKDFMKSAFDYNAQGCGAVGKGVGVAGREPIDMSSPLLGGKTSGRGATVDMDWAQGTSDMVGTEEGAGGADTGMEACMAGHTSRLARLCFLRACKKTSGLGPSPVRISKRKTKSVFFPRATE
jgi:hypothetical protein